MDLGLGIIAILIIAICIAPFIIMGRNNKKKEKQLLQTLSSLASQYNTSISHYDIWNHAAIGSDAGMQMIFFTKKNKMMESHQLVIMEDVQQCRIINSSRSVGNKGSHSHVIDKLDLAFTNRDRSKGETVLNFFDVDGDSLTVTRELHLAEKWNNLINEKIRTYAVKV